MNKDGYTDACIATFLNGGVEDYAIQISNNLTGEVDNRSDHSSTVSSAPSKIEIFPNPTTGLVNLKVADFIGKEMDIQVISQLGHVVRRYQYEKIEDRFIVLKLEDLNNGLYFIQFKTKEESPVVKRVIIN